MNIVCFGAHPDDPEFHAGGTLVQWARAGAKVLAVSLTDGRSGHHEIPPEELVGLRAEEARRAAEIGGYASRVLAYPDGRLQNTLELRDDVVRIIREHQADLVLTHRPWDYHPDHRYAAMAVQDAAFMVTVPHCCPEVSALRRNPTFLYMMDRFTKPLPFTPEIAVDVDGVMETKWRMLDAMMSQVYSWLPWLEGCLDEVPKDDALRPAFLERFLGPWFEAHRANARAALEATYGADHAQGVRFAESFEVCEYGNQPTPGELRALFPFLTVG